MTFSFSKLIEQYLLYLPIRFSHRTVETYAGRIFAIQRAINLNDLIINSKQAASQLKSSFVNLISAMSDKAANYKNLTIAAFNDFCKYCCRTYKSLCNIKISYVKKLRLLPKALSQKKILGNFKKRETKRETWIDYRNYALSYIIYGTGIRISEALSLIQSDFYKNGMLFIRNGKGAKERIVYHPDETLSYLKQYRVLCPYDTTKILWRSRTGGVLTRAAASGALKSFIGCRPHILRHSYATHLYANGCDILVLSELLGHSSLSSTQIYLKIQKKELQKCVLTYHPFHKNL
jgi:integrase/recombinase XerC